MPPLVYYSFASREPIAPAYEAAIRASVESLRARDGAIAAALCMFGAGMSPALARFLEERGVAVHAMGDYGAALAAHLPEARARVLERYPVLHKYLCIPALERAHAPSQLLYVDTDTLFGGAAGALLARCTEADVYAREEPFCRRSPLGYRPEYLDEDALAALARAEGAAPVAPFNVGCLLLNRGAWPRLGEALGALLERVWRFLVDAAARPPADSDGYDVRMFRRLAPDLPARDRSGLPYPSGNAWIKEEVALWLALGELRGLRIADFSRDDVVQGLEVFLRPETWTIAHYYSVNAAELARPPWAPPARPAPPAGARAAPARPPTLNPDARCTPVRYEGALAGVYVDVAGEARLIDRRRHPAAFAALRALLGDGDGDGGDSDGDGDGSGDDRDGDVELSPEELALLCDLGVVTSAEGPPEASPYRRSRPLPASRSTGAGHSTE